MITGAFGGGTEVLGETIGLGIVAILMLAGVLPILLYLEEGLGQQDDLC